MSRLIKGRSFYKEPWYNSYRSMNSRCYRTKDPSFKYYGGRGIKVCEEWMDIENFEKWVKKTLTLTEQPLTGSIVIKTTRQIIADGQRCMNRTTTEETPLSSLGTVKHIH